MGRPEATYKEVVEAAKKARCYDFILRLPYGFDTLVGEGGASPAGVPAIVPRLCLIAGLVLLVVGVVFYRILKSE